MRIVKAVFLITFVVLLTLPLEGCWNYREVEEMAIVAGVAIDKERFQNKYLLTTEIVDLRGEGKEAKIQSKRIEMEGKTIFDAIRNIVKVSAKRLYWTHADIIIISKEVAKEGIYPIIDFFHRDAEPRMTMSILISEENTAKELLSQQSITTDIRSIEMRTMLDNEKKALSKSPHMDLRNLINDLSGEGVSVVLPSVRVILNEGTPTSELSGTAVFKQDKLVGFLDEEETKFFLFVRNKVKGGILPMNISEDEAAEDVSLEIFDSKTKLKPVLVNGGMIMNIEVKTIVALGESNSTKNLLDEKGRKELINAAEENLKAGISNVVRKAKFEYDSDIFGFGRVVKREVPEYWKENKQNWDKIFANLKVNVTVNVILRGSGLTSKPIRTGD